MSSSPQEDLALHAEVVDVVTRYASGIDRRDWALFRSAFADDAKVDYGPFMGSWTTGDDFTAFMRESHSPAGLSVHRMTNVVITGTNPLTARTYGDALLQHRHDPTTVDHSAGYYDDEFIRTDDGLKIVSRTTVAVLHERLSGNMAAGNPDLPI
jgi:3-phenylpropionate/cinnamic acid dioxygenase small subunit